jgi:hypothetical protein
VCSVLCVSASCAAEKTELAASSCSVLQLQLFCISKHELLLTAYQEPELVLSVQRSVVQQLQKSYLPSLMWRGRVSQCACMPCPVVPAPALSCHVCWCVLRVAGM